MDIKGREKPLQRKELAYTGGVGESAGAMHSSSGPAKPAGTVDPVQQVLRKESQEARKKVRQTRERGGPGCAECGGELRGQRSAG